MGRIKLIALGALLVLSTSGAVASADSEATHGCCYPGTKTYFDQSGKAVGWETIGCGDDGAIYGTATNRWRWQPGCAI